MSTDTEHVDEGAETLSLETLKEWYHLPALGVVMAFMLWVRLLSYDSFATEDGTPRLSSIDPWYHWRTINWTVENWPHTMPFEVYTGFPEGHYSGQFGTLYDQIIATAAMIVGLGDPSQATIYTVALVAVPILGTLVAVPVFYAGRRLGGTIGGLVSVAILALSPGTFLRRSVTGNLDHHVAEVLFMAIALVAMMVALRVAETERPIYELVAERDWDALREPTIYSVLAGVALSLFIWVWPAAVFMVGILGVFFAVQLTLDYVRGVSPDHIAFVGVVSMGVTTIFTAFLMEGGADTIGVTQFSVLQPLLAFLVAAGCAFMAWLARQWNDRDLERSYYPAAIVGIGVAGLVFLAVVLPDLYSTIIGNLTGRLLPINPSETGLTVAEVQPPDNYTDYVFRQFGTAFYAMLAGVAILAVRPFVGREFRAEYTLVIVWTLFLISMSMTQRRFAYYLVLAVAIVSAPFVQEVLRLVDVERARNSIRDVETYQVIALLLVVMLLFVPLVPPFATVTATDVGNNVDPSHNGLQWEEANQWLEGNTPEPGAYGGADNASALEYYGSYAAPADDDYDYPEGAYGVMSWWDYGHFITVQGERIPHANPFQQNARPASDFLTATSEERAELILDAIAADVYDTGMSNEELKAAIAEAENSSAATDEEIRYVMIDHEMAGGKFSAITRWTGPGYSHYLDLGADQPQYSVQNQSVQLPAVNENYQQTQLASLYLRDATGMEHYRLVHENDEYAVVGSVARATQQGLQPTRLRQSFSLRQGWNNRTAQMAQQLALSGFTNQLVNYGGGTFLYDAQVVSTVKSFERVEGATITGSVDDPALENGTAAVSLELETEPGRTFRYTQQAEVGADGTFELTVPYATNDELGPEDGYTNSSVAANGSYTVQVVSADGNTTYQGETAVPETAVVEGQDVEVTLEETEDPPAEGNESAGNESAGADGNESDGTDGGDQSDGTNETETGNESGSIGAEPVAPASP